jgi:hypothetical protein
VPKQLADKDAEAIELFEEESDGEIAAVDDGDDAPEEDLSFLFQLKHIERYTTYF